ncbi:MAG: thioesterase family protein [Anaerolineae bacterium]
MPATHTASYTVRHYECDALGHLNNANYVRYMEEAAFNASAAVGYDKARYDVMGFLWLAHETEIEYLQPVGYGDSLEVKTWVGDFRRIRSRRMYEFRQAGQNGLVARASTDWVYLNAATLRPATIPPEMIAAFVPEGIEQMPPLTPAKAPTPPTPPPGVFIQRRRVEWRDIDTAGHVNNAVYFNYIEDCAMQAAVAHGWPLSRARAEGFAPIARQHHITYHNPALLDDEIEISTFVALHGKATADRFYNITRVSDGLRLAQAVTRWVWVDLKTGRPIRIPADYAADFVPSAVSSQMKTL